VTSRRSALRYCPLHLQLAHHGHPFFCVCPVPKNFRSSSDSLGACCRVQNCMDLLAVDLGCRQMGGPNWTSLLLHTALYARFFACKAISCPAAVQQLCNSCSTWCHCAFQHTLLWKPLVFFSYTSALMIPSIQQAHKLWGALLLHNQALHSLQ